METVAIGRDLAENVFQVHGVDKPEFTTCYLCVCRCGLRVTHQEGQVRLAEQ
jgi:hypothetical protein